MLCSSKGARRRTEFDLKILTELLLNTNLLQYARLSKMTPTYWSYLIDRLEFWMRPGEKAYLYLDQPDERELFDHELDVVVHPVSSWLLVMEFDERALDLPNYSQRAESTLFIKMIRRELFPPETTIRQMLDRIVAKPSYGWFEGFRKMGTSNGVPTFELCWGSDKK